MAPSPRSVSRAEVSTLMLRPLSDNFAQPSRAPTTPGLYRTVHLGMQKDFAAIVEDAHPVAIGDAASARIFRCDFKFVLMRLHFLMTGVIDECRVQEVVGLAR